MFDIDDITSMFAKISIENINTICVPLYKTYIYILYDDAQVMKCLKLIIFSYRNS